MKRIWIIVFVLVALGKVYGQRINKPTSPVVWNVQGDGILANINTWV